ncbi:hypothetical protein CLV30_109113 [Haloactinopolyspora alba]|uniref:Uncharacterized protein n=1 Tax=Haloactinopolyspora alba TaxID=648780 RepID=A0A2P8E000_9ACTN|nr:DUF6069 family protein [Haloactinopolyspora alba]PSL02805.1 hypothetical protein CLV30_109113 [Haloactinopolyspora alba]
MSDTPNDPARQSVDAGRLWAGGGASALVAALIAVAGIVIVRALFDVPVLAPEGDGVWGNANTWWYAIGAAVAALAATGLVHVLVNTTPRPLRFFGWVIGLVTVIAAVAPFTPDAELSAQLATSAINVVIGVAIGSLVSGSAHSAMRTARQRRDRPPHPSA